VLPDIQFLVLPTTFLFYIFSLFLSRVFLDYFSGDFSVSLFTGLSSRSSQPTKASLGSRPISFLWVCRLGETCSVHHSGLNSTAIQGDVKGFNGGSFPFFLIHFCCVNSCFIAF
jgi:hypothetical protein